MSFLHNSLFANCQHVGQCCQTTREYEMSLNCFKIHSLTNEPLFLLFRKVFWFVSQLAFQVCGELYY